MESTTTREAFGAQARALMDEFAGEVWRELIEGSEQARPDEWMREHGGALLRRMLGSALEARAERLGMRSPCDCGGKLEFVQRKRRRLHCVLAGRDVDVAVPYGRCERCRKGLIPLLSALGVDGEGFTPQLRELTLLAAVIEPYASASSELLGRFAGVDVSHEKARSLVAERGADARAWLERPERPSDDKCSSAQHYAMFDGGMIHVDKAWQECKVATLFSAEHRVERGENRHELTKKLVTAVRGTPDDLARRLSPRIESLGTLAKPVACIADGAAWIWNLFARLFPERVEILDWYHCSEHLAQAAAVLFDDETQAAEWKRSQEIRLLRDDVDGLLEGLAFLRKTTRATVKRDALDALSRYLTTHRERVRYGTFLADGLLIGSGAIESAINHVVQQRMKRAGMRWQAAGADDMLALRCVYRSTGHWDAFTKWRTAA